MPGGVVVKRQIQETTTTPVYYDDISSELPFYYNLDMRFCFLLIGLGILVGIFQFLGMGTLIMLPFLRKKYICLKCKHLALRVFKPKCCPICGGKIITEQEYNQNKTLLNNLYDGDNSH